jgi:argonaute-like protein implicated in RNA metabolism and viral defense
MILYGSIISNPYLRFNYSSTYAKESNPRRGLKRFGPYDSNIFNKSEINAGLIYLKSSKNKKSLTDGLVKGEGYFEGFHKFFRIPLVFKEERSIINATGKEIKGAIENLLNQDLDIVFIIEETIKTPLYKICKTILLANGIPSQVVIDEKLQNPKQRRWILENIALATYAKVGGTPWVIENPVSKNQLVLGVSRAQDKNKKYLVGFVTLFTQDGDFLLMHSKAPVIEWDDYVDGLKNLIIEAIEEYEKRRGAPEEVIIHFHKRPGYRELIAVENALKSMRRQIPYALLHINEYSNFRLFDTSHRTYIPESGLKVDISKHESILLIDGRIGNERRKVGVPRVLDIIMDKRSTLSIDNFPDLVKQISDFSRINWRGFNAAAIPVTLNYSKLIARLISEIGVEDWNQIVASGKLRDKSWFL